MFSFITILDAVLCLVLLGFNVWNWWLACTGYTTVEFFMAAAEAEGINIEEIDYSFQTVSDNLYRVFGTHKLMRILSPSLRNLHFTGLEWSFLQTDQGYDNNGFRLK